MSAIWSAIGPRKSTSGAGLGILVDEDPAVPDLAAHRHQAERRRCPGRRSCGSRAPALSVAVGAVGPRVVLAGQPTGGAAVVAGDGGAAVATRVVEGPQHAVLAAHDHDGCARPGGQPVRARLGPFGLVAGEEPGAGEDPFLLQLVEGGVGVPARRDQGARAPPSSGGGAVRAFSTSMRLPDRSAPASRPWGSWPSASPAPRLGYGGEHCKPNATQGVPCQFPRRSPPHRNATSSSRSSRGRGPTTSAARWSSPARRTAATCRTPSSTGARSAGCRSSPAPAAPPRAVSPGRAAAIETPGKRLFDRHPEQFSPGAIGYIVAVRAAQLVEHRAPAVGQPPVHHLGRRTAGGAAPRHARVRGRGRPRRHLGRELHAHRRRAAVPVLHRPPGRRSRTALPVDREARAGHGTDLRDAPVAGAL